MEPAEVLPSGQKVARYLSQNRLQMELLFQPLPASVIVLKNVPTFPLAGGQQEPD